MSGPASLHGAVLRACERIDHAWRRVHYDPEQFSGLVTRALGRARPPQALEQVAAWLVRTAVLPEQLASGRGATAITLFHNGSFALEVRYWADEDIGPHAHAVTGWARVLRGTCLQAAYRFIPSSRIGASVRLGAMSIVGAEHLSSGSSFELRSDRNQIHSIIPLEPVTVLICRTLTGMPASTPKYLMPALEYAPMALGALTTRRLQMVRMLERLDTGRATPAAIDAVRACDPELAVHLLMELAPSHGGLEEFKPILDAVTQMRPELEALTVVFEELFRDRALQRVRRTLPEVRQRLGCALMSLPLSWRQLRTLARSVGPGPAMTFLVDACAGMATRHGMKPGAESIQLRRDLRALLQRSQREAGDGQPWWVPIRTELGQRLGLSMR